MAKQLKLSAQVRTGVGRSANRKLKSAGLVPASIYGAKEAPVNLQISTRAVQDLLSHAAGEHFLVDVEIEENGQKTNRLALVQEVQHHPVSQAILHLDLHAVKSDEAITAEIPVEGVGEPVGVKTYGGLLEQLVRNIEIECLPKDLPEFIQVDISGLGLGESIHIRDIKLPEGVTAVTDGDVTAFLVAEPRVTEEAAPAATPAAPEVIKEKKPETEAAKK